MPGFGIDLFAKYQTVTDWTAVKNYRLQAADGNLYPISFIMCKGTDGGGRASSPADSLVAGAKSIGVPVGLYHYAEMSPTPEAQADICILEVQRLAAYGVKPALDLESPFSANATALDFGARFLNRMLARGYPAELYWNNAFDVALRSQMEQRVNGYVKWIARYGAMPQLTPDVHQYSSTGSIPGIQASGIDMNWAYTDSNFPAPVHTQPPGNNKYNKDSAMLIVPSQFPQGGVNEHVFLPTAGLPQFWYLATGYGHKLYVHQVDYIMPTWHTDRYVPDSGFNSGSGDGQNDALAWVFNSDKPGPVPGKDVSIPAHPDGTQPAGVSIRFTSRDLYPFTLSCN